MRRHARDGAEGDRPDARHGGRARRGRARAAAGRVGLRPSVPLAGGTLDRAAGRRTDEAWLREALREGRALDLATGAVVPLAGRAPLALLGVEADGAALWLVDDAVPADLRPRVTTEPDPARQGLLAYAAHLAHFHRSHRFCGRCGCPTAPVDAGHARRCEAGHTAHARTDPVVIMLVADGRDRVVLGRQHGWPPGRYSALAGFVEPGESLEGAVAREVLEEAGVAVGQVAYVASQPWPFPASLMLGFRAEWAGGEPAVGDAELEDVRWFSRAEVAAAAREEHGWEPTAAGGLVLPPRLAIARHLVEDWLAR